MLDFLLQPRERISKFHVGVGSVQLGADGGAIVDRRPRGSGVGTMVGLQAPKGVVVSLHPLKLPVNSFPSRFHPAAGRELLCDTPFFLPPTSPRISH